MKTTPGPWTEAFGFISAPLTPGLAVVRNRADGTNVTPEEFRANARLIASAPELYGLLVRIASETCDHGPMPFCPREEARALLGKIDGGE